MFPSTAFVLRSYAPDVAVLWRAAHRTLRAIAMMLAGLVLAALALALASPPARAQSAAPHITTSLVASGTGPAGRAVTLALWMRPAAGWHGYWLNPGDAGFPMRVTWHLPAGAHVGELRYPVPGTLVLAGLMNHVYERDYAVLAELTLPTGVAAGTALPLTADAEWLACSASICVPERAHLATTVTVGGGVGGAGGGAAAQDSRFDAWRAALPAPLGAPAHFAIAGDRLRIALPFPAAAHLGTPHLFIAADGIVDYPAPQVFTRDGDTLIASLHRVTTGAQPGGATGARAVSTVSGVLRLDGNSGDGGGVAFTATPGDVPAGGTPIASDTSAPRPVASLPLLLLAALAGGLLLNVMPCVFPILSLKALSLARSGGDPRAARVESLAYTGGVILACVALGGLLLALRAGGSAVGWAFQLQEPRVVAALLLLAVGITANLLGLFEFTVPGFASHGTAGQTGARGAFATGLLAAFVATPCTGPFMASAMGAALLLPVIAGLALFATLGLGIALPFLAIGFVPALRRLLPRPGAWMRWFRLAMAVPMALTALALVWLASRLGGWLFAGAAVLIALAMIALLGGVGRAQRRGATPSGWLAGGLAALFVITALSLPQAIRAPTAEAAEILAAAPFTESALAQARAAHHAVFVFFTADWCLTCKVNERVAIERPATRDAFARRHVVVLKGDWTRRDPAISRFLTARGAAGVPLYLWYPADGSAPRELPQVLTPGLLAAL